MEHFEGTLLQAMQAGSLQETPRSGFTNSLASSYDSLGSQQTRSTLQCVPALLTHAPSGSAVLHPKLVEL